MTDGGLEVLTGLRSGKRSYYPEYVRSAERFELVVQALDGISRALVRTAAGPRPLVEWVVRTAAAHLRADWLLFVVADGVLPAARPRFLALNGGQIVLGVGDFLFGGGQLAGFFGALDLELVDLEIHLLKRNQRISFTWRHR